LTPFFNTKVLTELSASRNVLSH